MIAVFYAVGQPLVGRGEVVETKRVSRYRENALRSIATASID